ncbi:MAG TPA: YdcF family protein [Cyanobacteria bacterium UBA8156]|jgi:uncharacterized SAM-binding protein YcdF (DUF218 family)|nr:YdcF family protein [Cyanobacteria bacterium UBA8156]
MNKKPRQGWQRYGMGVGALVLVAIALSVSNWAQADRKIPAILVLGGAEDREWFAARLAQRMPSAGIYVSSGSPEAYARYVFAKSGIPPERVHLDYRAADTVTNFTTMVEKLLADGVTDVYLVTSAFHMPRARAIGTIVLGSRGLVIHPQPVPTPHAPEPAGKIARDSLRSLFWLVTGAAPSKALP